MEGFLGQLCAATPSNIYLCCGPIGPDGVLSCSYLQQLQMGKEYYLKRVKVCYGHWPCMNCLQWAQSNREFSSVVLIRSSSSLAKILPVLLEHHYIADSPYVIVQTPCVNNRYFCSLAQIWKARGECEETRVWVKQKRNYSNFKLNSNSFIKFVGPSTSFSLSAGLF